MKHIIHMDEVHVSSYANLVLLNKTYASMESKRWNRARRLFLSEQRKKGSLKCFYCKKDNLKLRSLARKDQATVDHYVPKSGGGDKFSSSNFVVCCHSCNQRKGNMTPYEFLNSSYIKKKTFEKI
jgi:5-methylcytosine-specific restriction endonuclease McrA